jgi:hypothetical protein
MKIGVFRLLEAPVKMDRIAIIFPTGNIESVPSLMGIITSLSDAGFLIDIFSFTDHRFVKPKFSSKNVTIFDFNRIPRITWHNIKFSIPSGFYWRTVIRKRGLKDKYKWVIAVDQEGLFLANRFFKGMDNRLVYFSLEIFFMDELKNPLHIAAKKKEIEISQHLKYVIVQDPERGQVLKEQNHISKARFIYFPNSPPGPAYHNKSTYLHDKYHLPSNKKIILSSGSLFTWTCIPDLVFSTREWPSDWVLVLHNRESIKGGYGKAYFETLKLLGNHNVIFSLDPVTEDEYRQIIQSADIGVAFYKTENDDIYFGKNIIYLGRSSGKIAYYLQAGIPILVNQIASVEKMTELFQCGQVIKDPKSTRDAIQAIFNRWNFYSDNAVKCYQNEWDFSTHFDNLVSILKEIGPE